MESQPDLLRRQEVKAPAQSGETKGCIVVVRIPNESDAAYPPGQSHEQADKQGSSIRRYTVPYPSERSHLGQLVFHRVGFPGHQNEAAKCPHNRCRGDAMTLRLRRAGAFEKVPCPKVAVPLEHLLL